MKVDHPIRINHARAGQPAGGRWERLDEVARGQVQLVRVPADRNVQAQLAMKEIERLQALDCPSRVFMADSPAPRSPVRYGILTLETPTTILEVHGLPAIYPLAIRTRQAFIQ